MPTLSDEALIAACAAGDSAALGVLFDRFASAVCRFLTRLIGASYAEIDDLAQATFIEVWRCSPKFRGDSKARVWIFGIANNVARRHVRSRSRRLTALERFGLEPVSPERPLDEATHDRRLIERLAATLPTLTEGQRVAFVMCDLEGVPGVEAARVLGLRPGTLGRRLFEARRVLRKALEGGER